MINEIKDCHLNLKSNEQTMLFHSHSKKPGLHCEMLNISEKMSKEANIEGNMQVSRVVFRIFAQAMMSSKA